MSEYGLRTVEHEEAVYALEAVAEWSGRIEATTAAEARRTAAALNRRSGRGVRPL